jgi:putative transposase
MELTDIQRVQLANGFRIGRSHCLRMRCRAVLPKADSLSSAKVEELTDMSLRFKVHVIVTFDGIPVEYTFTTGSTHDLDGIRQMPLNLPDGSEILADAACTDYAACR